MIIVTIESEGILKAQFTVAVDNINDAQIWLEENYPEYNDMDDLSFQKAEPT